MKFYQLREDHTKFYNYHFTMVHKAPYDAKHGKELKILTPKQILQRLLLALA